MKTVKVLSLMLLGVVAICVIVALTIPTSQVVGVGLSSKADAVAIHAVYTHGGEYA